MTQVQQPEALRMADAIEKCSHNSFLSPLMELAAELRRQHTRISELEAQLTAAQQGVELEVDDLIDRLLNAQQDLNLAANVHMDQSIASASTLLDEVEIALRALAATHPTQQGMDAQNEWEGIESLPVCDDLIWLYCQDTNTIEGPIAPCPSFVDSWTHWAYANAPSTVFIDAALAAQAKQGERP